MHGVRTDALLLNVVPMWPSRFDMKLKCRVFLSSVNEFESHAHIPGKVL